MKQDTIPPDAGGRKLFEIAGLTPEEVVQLTRCALETPYLQTCVDELATTIGSASFANKHNVQRFVAHCGLKSLLGRLMDLKEVCIAKNLLRLNNYDPAIDNTVRLMAHDARKCLHQHFQFQGRNSPLMVAMNRGCYRVAFEERRAALCILEFSDPSPQANADTDFVRRLLRDEIRYRLNKSPALLVASDEAGSCEGPRFRIGGQIGRVGDVFYTFVSAGHSNKGDLIGVTLLSADRDNFSLLAAEISRWVLTTIQPRVEIDLGGGAEI